MNSCAIKRLNSEFKKFSNNLSNDKLYINNSDINIEICDIGVSSENKKIGILINNKLVLTMFILNDYPFKPPLDVFVCRDSVIEKYDKWSIRIFEDEKNSGRITGSNGCDCSLGWAFSIIKYPALSKRWKFIPRNNSNECLCCNSIICGSNWVPTLRIYDIFNEYFGRRIFSLYCSKLQQRIIKLILNNDKWNIPEDIVFHIVDLLIAKNKNL